MSPSPLLTEKGDMQSWPYPFDRHSRRVRHYWLIVLCFCTGCVLTWILVDQWTTPSPVDAVPIHQGPTKESNKPPAPAIAIAVASQRGDNTSWLNFFSKWPKTVYVTDDPAANLTVPANKGREGMVYLTWVSYAWYAPSSLTQIRYIIDNYDNLPETIIFSHSKRFQWHNDDPLYDGQAVLERLNIPYVQSEGYVNLRCVWNLGCPAEIRPLVEAEAPFPASDPHSEGARAGSFYKETFEELFPNVTVPEQVGLSCCAQFAATAKKIRERPKSDYLRYRDWLIRTPLKDHLSGRILEYSWHSKSRRRGFWMHGS